MTRLAVVGTGLIGTSVALAARAAGKRVYLVDRDGATLSAAVARGAGTPLPDDEPPVDLAVIAVPPAATAAALCAVQHRGLASVYTDVASTKAGVVESIRRAGCDMSSYVPGHPMAGGERHGPAQADASLFEAAAWVLCPQRETAAEALATVRALVSMCGARPVEMDAVAHDAAVAAVSHAPHVVASALAAGLVGVPAEAVALAGKGVRDTTRIAAGDPALWTDILTQNAGPVAEAVSGIVAELSDAAAILAKIASGDDGQLPALTQLLARGRAGRARLSP